MAEPGYRGGDRTLLEGKQEKQREKERNQKGGRGQSSVEKDEDGQRHLD